MDPELRQGRIIKGRDEIIITVLWELESPSCQVKHLDTWVRVAQQGNGHTSPIATSQEEEMVCLFERSLSELTTLVELSLRIIEKSSKFKEANTWKSRKWSSKEMDEMRKFHAPKEGGNDLFEGWYHPGRIVFWKSHRNSKKQTPESLESGVEWIYKTSQHRHKSRIATSQELPRVKGGGGIVDGREKKSSKFGNGKHLNHQNSEMANTMRQEGEGSGLFVWGWHIWWPPWSNCFLKKERNSEMANTWNGA
jgi:hypothetical protein